MAHHSEQAQTALQEQDDPEDTETPEQYQYAEGIYEGEGSSPIFVGSREDEWDEGDSGDQIEGSLEVDLEILPQTLSSADPQAPKLRHKPRALLNLCQVRDKRLP